MQRKFRDETEGIVSIPLFIRTAEVFLHSRKPVKTLADLKGLKLRTAGAWLEMAQGPGRGTGDHRRRRGLPDARARRDRRDRVGHALGEHHARASTRSPSTSSTPACTSPRRPSSSCINKDAWSKLSAADQKLVETVAKLVTFESWLKIGAGGRQGARLLQEGRQRDHRARRRGAVRRPARSASTGRTRRPRRASTRGSPKCTRASASSTKPGTAPTRWRTVKVKPPERTPRLRRAAPATPRRRPIRVPTRVTDSVRRDSRRGHAHAACRIASNAIEPYRVGIGVAMLLVPLVLVDLLRGVRALRLRRADDLGLRDRLHR